MFKTRTTWSRAMARPKPRAAFTGRWHIVSMDEWDVHDTEDDPAFIEFGSDQLGEFQVGLTSGNIDYRLTERGELPAVEWSWEGMDEMDPCTGRGWAILEGEELRGMIFFHQGDESAFVAKRTKGTKGRRRR
jgi:hypothetical protein